MFRLYYAPGTCALATHIALEEAGAPYEAVLVDFRSQSQRSPEYLAVNPKGRVPGHSVFRRPNSPRWLIPSLSRKFRSSTATFVRRCMSRMRTACAAPGGRMTPQRSRQ